ncbi:MAG: hypothetical protein Q4E91_08800 [Lachnospiraceae bacterium]|nr:hypothetical protein [Lachnospiraceae bacterium]
MEKWRFILETIYKDIRGTFYLHTVVLVILAAGVIVPLWTGTMIRDLYWDASLSSYENAQRLIVAEYLDEMCPEETVWDMKTAPERVGIGAFLKMTVSWNGENVSAGLQGCTDGFWKLNGYKIVEGSGPEEEWKGPGAPCYLNANGVLCAKGARPGDILEANGTEFTVAGIIQCPKLYGKVVLPYEEMAALAEGRQVQYQTLFLFEEPVKVSQVRSGLSGMRQILSVCRGQEQEQIYFTSVQERVREKLLVGGLLLIFTGVSLFAINSGMLAQERQRIAVRLAAGAGEGWLFAEYMLRMELLLTAALLIDCLIYPQMFGTMRGMSRYPGGWVVLEVWLLAGIFLLASSGVLWHGMCRKKGAARMLREGI